MWLVSVALGRGPGFLVRKTAGPNDRGYYGRTEPYGSTVPGNYEADYFQEDGVYRPESPGKRQDLEKGGIRFADYIGTGSE
jgi:hypothetical protein